MAAFALAWFACLGPALGQGGRFVDEEIPRAPRVVRDLAANGQPEEAAAATRPIGDYLAPGEQGIRLRSGVTARRDAGKAAEIAWAYFDQKNWTAADLWFANALTWNPKNANAAEGVILTAFRSGDSARAYGLADDFAGLVPDARRIVTGAIDAEAWKAVEAGQIDTAEKILQPYPADEPAFARVRAEIASRRVDKAVAGGNYAAARSIAEGAGIGTDQLDRKRRGDLLLRAAKAQDRRQFRESLTLLTEAEAIAPLARDESKMKAWSLYHTRRYDESASLFERLYRESPDKDTAEGITYSLQQDGRVYDLSQLSRSLGGLLKTTADPVLEAAARQEAARQERERAAGAHGASPPQAANYPRGRNRHAAPGAPYQQIGPKPIRPLDGVSPAAGAAQALQAGEPLETSRRLVPDSDRVALEAGFRSKTGDAGLSELSTVTLPGVSGTVVFGPENNQSVTLNLRHLSLDAGDFTGDRLVGSAPPDTLDSLDRGRVTTSADSLVEPRLAYRQENGATAFFAELGTTPLGGEVDARPVGAIGLDLKGDGGEWRVEAFSESVTESILSYTGIVDPYTGDAWGRVVKSGLRTDGYLGLGGGWGAYGAFEWAGLTGEQVADNSVVSLTAGVNRAIDLPGFEYLSVGPSFHFEHYEKNLSHFTTGHGGYFSPDSLVMGMFGASFLTETGGPWLLEGYVGAGAQSNDQARAPVLPLSPDGRYYDAAGNSSLTFTARVQALFELNPHWHLGANAGFSKTAAFEDYGAALYFSYLFEPRFGLDRGDFLR
ncbi:MAG: BCSC C-terminal domain-containing protein [Verrucomicrobiae bacterium]|nr:BCSC C-terminal domain-containing protein [Verrucomicrobiae bacterium]